MSTSRSDLDVPFMEAEMSHTCYSKLIIVFACCLLATFASSAQSWEDPLKHDARYVTITNNGNRQSIKVKMRLQHSVDSKGKSHSDFKVFEFRVRAGETWKSPVKYRMINEIEATMYERNSDFHPIKCQPSIKRNLWTDEVSHIRFDTIFAQSLCRSHAGN